MQEVKLVVSYDDYEDGIRMEKLIKELAAKPEARLIGKSGHRRLGTSL